MKVGYVRQILFSVLLCGIGLHLPAQSVTQPVTGRVIDARDGYPISYARITWDTLYEGVYSEADGSFILPAPDGNLPPQVFVVALGYRTAAVARAMLQQTVNGEIRLEQLSLAPVLVQASITVQRGVLTPSVARLQNVPVVLGQADLLKSLTVYPGIAGGREGLTGIHVRGGNDDQNLYILDGTIIYNPGHLFGFLSVFSPNMVSSVDVYKDYVPARLARRLSAVVDVATRTGQTGSRLRSREIGLLGFSYTDEGSLRDTSLTYAASMRLAHTAALTLVTLPGYLARKDSPLLFAGMYDMNLKLTKRFSPYRQLTGAVYLGDDLYGGTVHSGAVSETSAEGSALLRYGNRSLSLAYDLRRPGGGRHFTQLNLGGFRNGYRLREVRGRNGSEGESLYTNRAALQEYRLSHRWSFGGLRRSFVLGGSLDHLVFEPSRILVREGATRREPEAVVYRTTEMSTSVDATFDLGRRSTLRGGLRAAALYLANDRQVEPALSYHVALDRTIGRGSIALHYRHTRQLIHSVDVASGGLPVRVWTPVSRRLPMETDRSIVLTYDRSDNSGYRLYSSVYGRRFSNQVLLPQRSLTVSENTDWQGTILGGGVGWSYGLELYLEKPLSGWILGSLSYTYARSLRTFRNFNRDRRFPYDYDRPHDLYLSLDWRLSERWSVVSAFALSSGLPVSQPTANAIDFQGNTYPVLQEYNNGRLPLYHRADLLVSRQRRTRRGKESHFKFGIYNLYGRRNPLFMSYGLRGSGTIDPATGNITRQLRDDFRFGSLFTFFPMLSYEVSY